MTDASQGSAASIDASVLPSPPPGEGKYRIALSHPDPEHPNTAVFAWRKLYVLNPDFHDAHYDPLAAARADLDVAMSEFPDHDAWVEVLVDNHDETFTETQEGNSISRVSNGDGTHSWVPVDAPAAPASDAGLGG